MHHPVIDLHCDLTSYLDTVRGSTVYDKDAIGCALPHLLEGGVKLQVMAVFSLTEKGSTTCGARQFRTYREWISGSEPGLRPVISVPGDLSALSENEVSTFFAIENASCFAEEEEPVQDSFLRLEEIISATGKPRYITITHHAENRFGGGNLTDIGLKEDGKRLLEFMAEKGIAVDFSHTCDRFAGEILDFLERERLDIPVLASHSNFRMVWDHARNLPDWLADAIHAKGGIIGLNLVRDFVNPERPEAWLDHLQYGSERAYRLAWGADYFSPAIMPPQYAFREPYFHPEHQNASCYPNLMQRIPDWDDARKAKFAWENALEWLHRSE